MKGGNKCEIKFSQTDWTKLSNFEQNWIEVRCGLGEGHRSAKDLNNSKNSDIDSAHPRARAS